MREVRERILQVALGFEWTGEMATWFMFWGSDEDPFWASGSLCFFPFQRCPSPNSALVLLFRSTVEKNNGKNKHQNKHLPLGTQIWSNTREKGIQSLCGQPHLPPSDYCWKLCLLKSVSNSAICHVYHKITASKEWTEHERSLWLNFPHTFEGPAYTTLSRMSPSPEFWGTTGSFFSREAYLISGQRSMENFISL